MKIYVLLYEGVQLFGVDVQDVGSKYASDELQHENIEVCFLYYMTLYVNVLACLLTVQYYPFRLSRTEVMGHVRYSSQCTISLFALVLLSH